MQYTQNLAEGLRIDLLWNEEGRTCSEVLMWSCYTSGILDERIWMHPPR